MEIGDRCGSGLHVSCSSMELLQVGEIHEGHHQVRGTPVPRWSSSRPVHATPRWRDLVVLREDHDTTRCRGMRHEVRFLRRLTREVHMRIRGSSWQLPSAESTSLLYLEVDRPPQQRGHVLGG